MCPCTGNNDRWTRQEVNVDNVVDSESGEEEDKEDDEGDVYERDSQIRE